MCLKPQPSCSIPPDTKALVGRLLDEGTVYRFVGDVLFERFRDEDFADLYPKTGQPAISPVLLSFVLIFKSLERCSNRQAAINVLFRLDWKYALHLPLTYPSFDRSVLVEFRIRLREHQAEGRVFDAVLARLKELGMYKARGTQRTDSLAVLSPTRPLRRLELVCDAIRVAVKTMVKADPEWTRSVIPAEWEEKYGRPCKSERMSSEEREKQAAHVGRDGQWLLDRLEEEDAAHLRELRDVETFRLIWKQHYTRAEDGSLAWTSGGDHGGADAIETPYDPEARWSKKGRRMWRTQRPEATFHSRKAGFRHCGMQMREMARIGRSRVFRIGTQNFAVKDFLLERFATTNRGYFSAPAAGEAAGAARPRFGWCFRGR